MTKTKGSSLTQQNSEILTAPSSAKTSFYNTIESERYVNGWYITTWYTWECYDLVAFLRESDCPSYLLETGGTSGYITAGLSNKNTYKGVYYNSAGPQCSIELNLPIGEDGTCVIPKGYIEQYRYLQVRVGEGDTASWLPSDGRKSSGYHASMDATYTLREDNVKWSE